MLKTSDQQFLAIIIQEDSAFSLTCFVSSPFERIPVLAKLNLYYYLESNEIRNWFIKSGHAAIG